MIRYLALVLCMGTLGLSTASCAKKYRRSYAGKTVLQTPAAVSAGKAGAPTKSAVARMLVRTVSMDLEVHKVDEARNRVEQITLAAGGYVHRGAYAVEGARRRFSATLKVPPAALAKVLSALRAVGKVQGEHLDTVEVTAAVMDVRARLKSHRTAEQRLQQIALQQTASVKELLSVEKELARLRVEIERLEATERHYAGSVGLATITVGLAPRLRPAAKPGAWARVSGAFAAGLRHLLDFLVLLAMFIGHLWPFVLLLLAVSVVLYRLRRALGRLFTTLFGVKPMSRPPAYAGAAHPYYGYNGYADPRSHGNHTQDAPADTSSPPAPRDE